MNVLENFEMANQILPKSLGKSLQLAFVVKDLVAAIEFWTGTMNVGPFVMFEGSLGERKFLHRGRVSPVEMEVALAYMGDIQIELICQTNNAPSTYNDFIMSGREGLHHLGFYPDDYLPAYNELLEKGFVEVGCIQAPDGSRSVAYLEGQSVVGTIIEVAPLNNFRKLYFDAIKDLSKKWNRKEKVLKFKSREEFIKSVQ